MYVKIPAEDCLKNVQALEDCPGTTHRACMTLTLDLPK